jgi:hypothetical protein
MDAVKLAWADWESHDRHPQPVKEKTLVAKA